MASANVAVPSTWPPGESIFTTKAETPAAAISLTCCAISMVPTTSHIGSDSFTKAPLIVSMPMAPLCTSLPDVKGTMPPAPIICATGSGSESSGKS